MPIRTYVRLYVRTYVICRLLMALASTPPHTGTMPCRNERESTVNGWRQRQISGTSRMESKMASAPASAPASVWLRPRLRSRHRPRLRAGHRARFRPRLRSSTRFFCVQTYVNCRLPPPGPGSWTLIVGISHRSHCGSSHFRLSGWSPAIVAPVIVAPAIFGISQRKWMAQRKWILLRKHGSRSKNS